MNVDKKQKGLPVADCLPAAKNTVGVVGAGQMGCGIAHAFAQHGYFVQLIDSDKTAIGDAAKNIERNLRRQAKKEIIGNGDIAEILSRIKTGDKIVFSPPPFLAVEAVVEKFNIKKNALKKMDAATRDDTLIVSNTSSIGITRLSESLRRPAFFCGMHFMNPAQTIPFVEVVRGEKTTDKTVAAVCAVAAKLKKTTLVARDCPGFVVNRLLIPMINEAIFALQENIAAAADIDAAMRLGMNHPMGPLALADLIGLDVCLAIMQELRAGFADEKYRPCPLLEKMNAAGFLGRKTNIGFYDYRRQPPTINAAMTAAKDLQ